MSWILTYTGKHFDFRDIDPDVVCIQDIAHALGKLCRFNGHCARFHSVAEHSIAVCDLLPIEFKLEGLLHDAAEAYIGDCVQPLKMLLGDYRAIEQGVNWAIRTRFGLPSKMSPEVKHADLRVLATERMKLIPDDPTPWAILEGIAPAESLLVGVLNPDEAAARFLGRFIHLTADGGREA